MFVFLELSREQRNRHRPYSITSDRLLVILRATLLFQSAEHQIIDSEQFQENVQALDTTAAKCVSANGISVI